MHGLNHKVLLQRFVVVVLIDLADGVVHHILADGQALLVEVVAVVVGFGVDALLGAVHVLHVLRQGNAFEERRARPWLFGLH